MNPEPKTLTTSRLIIRKISQDLEFFDLGKNTVFKITTTTTEKGKKGSISHSYGIADSDEFSIAVDDVDTSKDKPFTQALNSCNKISSWYFVDEPEKISQIHTPTHKDLLGRACTYMYDFIHIHEIPNNADLYEDAKRGGKKLFKFDLFDHQVYDIHGELVRQPQFEDFCFRDGRYSDLEGGCPKQMRTMLNFVIPTTVTIWEYSLKRNIQNFLSSQKKVEIIKCL